MNKNSPQFVLEKALLYAQQAEFEKAQAFGMILIRKMELAGVFKVGDVTHIKDQPKDRLFNNPQPKA